MYKYIMTTFDLFLFFVPQNSKMQKNCLLNMTSSPELLHYCALYKFLIPSSAQTIVIFFFKIYNAGLNYIFVRTTYTREKIFCTIDYDFSYLASVY